MKAVAIFPGNSDSIHSVELPMPQLENVADGRGTLVRVLRVGFCGTDKEIKDGEYGTAAPGYDFLVMGHENFGIVEEVGLRVTEIAPGDFVVSLVRRPGNSIYDAIGRPDMTTDDEYHEHGISLLHGFLAEYYVDTPEYLVRVPRGLRKIGVLVEPMSVVEKGISQAFEIQRRLRVWKPRRAAVLGAGTIGLLATLALRLRGIDVVTIGRRTPPYLNADLIEDLGATYINISNTSLAELSVNYGPFDLMFEATGFSPIAFEAMNVLGSNGVLVLSSVTGGERTAEVPTDKINQGFVLRNKVMVGTVNASRDDYEAAVSNIALAEAQYSGWLPQLLTHQVNGLGEYKNAFELLSSETRAIKVFMEVSALE